jgi:hypothetical protein
MKETISHTIGDTTQIFGLLNKTSAACPTPPCVFLSANRAPMLASAAQAAQGRDNYEKEMLIYFSGTDVKGLPTTNRDYQKAKDAITVKERKVDGLQDIAKGNVKADEPPPAEKTPSP